MEILDRSVAVVIIVMHKMLVIKLVVGVKTAGLLDDVVVIMGLENEPVTQDLDVKVLQDQGHAKHLHH